MSTKASWRAGSVLLLALVLGITTPVVAQEYGGVYGTVTDTGGDELPGVTVTLSGVGAPRVTETGLDGQYRFIGLDPGAYGLVAELDGFSTVEQPNIVVSLNRNTNIVVTLSAAVEETITVTSESPLLDERKLASGTSISNIELEKIPTARDPWSVLNQAPGVLVDRINVGGNESGQQSNFVGLGTQDDENDFQVDGVQITDMAAIGASPSYYDFDQFEAVELSTGGTDVTKNSAGVGVNLVTKRGTNEFRGSARINQANDSFFGGFLEQGKTSIPESDLGPNQDSFDPRKINRVIEYGVEAGGPVVQDRLWAWGSYGVNDIAQVNFGGGDDNTLLENTSLKLNGQLSQNNSAVGSWNVGDKQKFGRGAGTTRPVETTWDQRGPTDIYKLEDTHVFSSNFYLTGQASKVDGGFSLTAKGPTDGSVNAYQDAGGVWRNTYYSGPSQRPQEELRIDGSYFFNTGSVSHELKFGGRNRDFESESPFGWPGGLRVRDGSNVGQADPRAEFVQEGAVPHALEYTSFWLQDTISKGNWTINAGFRLDQQEGLNSGENIPGSAFTDQPANGDPTPAEALPAITGATVDPGFDWDDITPRIGVTYALGEERKTLLRGSFSQFPEQLSSTDITALNSSTQTIARYTYEDLGGGPEFNTGIDRLLDLQAVLGGGADNPNLIDPGLDAPLTSEIILGVEHALLPEFVLGLSATIRDTDDVIEFSNLYEDTATGEIFTPGRGDFVLGTPVTGTLPDGTEVITPTFVPRDGLEWTGGTIQRNGVRSVEYEGLSFNFTKRLSNQWMLRGFFNYGEATWGVPESFFSNNDPNVQTNDPVFLTSRQRGDVDGEVFYSPSSGSGRGNIFLQSTWQWNVAGMYQVAPSQPWGFNISANLYGREGYPIPYFVNSTGSDGVQRQVSVAGTDAFRTDEIFTTDVRLEKEFASSGNVGLTVSLDAFNIFDESYILARQPSLGAGNADEVQDALSPRVYRIGVRVNWR